MPPGCPAQTSGLPTSIPPTCHSLDDICLPAAALPRHASLALQGQVMVRHTKKQVLGGEEVLRLPPKSEETIPGEHAWERACRGCCCHRSGELAYPLAVLPTFNRTLLPIPTSRNGADCQGAGDVQEGRTSAHPSQSVASICPCPQWC